VDADWIARRMKRFVVRRRWRAAYAYVCAQRGWLWLFSRPHRKYSSMTLQRAVRCFVARRKVHPPPPPRHSTAIVWLNLAPAFLPSTYLFLPYPTSTYLYLCLYLPPTLPTSTSPPTPLQLDRLRRAEEARAAAEKECVDAQEEAEVAADALEDIAADAIAAAETANGSLAAASAALAACKAAALGEMSAHVDAAVEAAAEAVAARMDAEGAAKEVQVELGKARAAVAVVQKACAVVHETATKADGATAALEAASAAEQASIKASDFARKTEEAVNACKVLTCAMGHPVTCLPLPTLRTYLPTNQSTYLPTYLPTSSFYYY
jgi:hypothetical protein